MNDLDPAILQKLLSQWQSGNQSQSVSDGQYGIQPIYGWNGGDGGTQTITPGVFAPAPDSADGKRQIDQWDPYTGKYIGRGTDTTSWTSKDWLMAIGGLTGAAALGGAFAGAGATGIGGATGGTSAGAIDSAALGLDGATATGGLSGGAVSLTPAEIAAGVTMPTMAEVGALAPTITPEMIGASAAAGGATGSGLNSMRAGEIANYSTNGSLPSSAAVDAGAAASSSGILDPLYKAATSPLGSKLLSTAAGALVSGAAANSLAPNPDSSKLDQLLSTYLTEMGKTSARADDQWNNYLSTWRPVENKYAQSILNYDTPGRREQAANEAGSGVAAQFDLARSAGLRDAQAAGVDPSTIAALGAASRIEEAKATAGAKNTARTDVEKTGLTLLQGGANFGRNLPNTSLNASSVATGQGNSAGNATVAANKMETDATTSRNQLFGDLFGAGLKAYGMGLFSGGK